MRSCRRPWCKLRAKMKTIFNYNYNTVYSIIILIDATLHNYYRLPTCTSCLFLWSNWFHTKETESQSEARVVVNLWDDILWEWQLVSEVFHQTFVSCPPLLGQLPRPLFPIEDRVRLRGLEPVRRRLHIVGRLYIVKGCAAGSDKI